MDRCLIVDLWGAGGKAGVSYPPHLGDIILEYITFYNYMKHIKIIKALRKQNIKKINVELSVSQTF